MEGFSTHGCKKDKNCVGDWLSLRVLLADGVRYPQKRAGSEQGLPRGNKVRIWQPSNVDTWCLWNKYLVKVRCVNGKGCQLNLPKMTPWVSKLYSALEKRFCCNETCPFK